MCPLKTRYLNKIWINSPLRAPLGPKSLSGDPFHIPQSPSVPTFLIANQNEAFKIDSNSRQDTYRQHGKIYCLIISFSFIFLLCAIKISWDFCWIYDKQNASGLLFDFVRTFGNTNRNWRNKTKVYGNVFSFTRRHVIECFWIKMKISLGANLLMHFLVDGL